MIGSTSWIIPGTYYENCRILEKYVDFAELLLYTWDKDTKNLIKKEIPYLKKLNLKYTVHLPTDNIENVIKLLEFFDEEDIEILNFVLHPLDGWEKVKNHKNISLENLKDRLEYNETMTFDIGHHITGKKFDIKYKNYINEFHIMGTDGINDHINLNDYTLNEFKPFYIPEKLYCFEIFELNEMLQSCEKWKKFVSEVLHENI